MRKRVTGCCSRGIPRGTKENQSGQPVQSGTATSDSRHPASCRCPANAGSGATQRDAVIRAHQLGPQRELQCARQAYPHSIRLLTTRHATTTASGFRAPTCEQLHPLPGVGLQLLRSVVHTDHIQKEVGRVEMVGAPEAQLSKVGIGFPGTPKVHHAALGEQQQVVEHRKDAGSRLVDGSYQGTATVG